jgi:hypothetical protein
MGDAWMLMKMFGAAQHDAVFEALHDFVQNNHRDRKAAMIFTASAGGAAVQFVYDGPSPPSGAWGTKFQALLGAKPAGRKMAYTGIVSVFCWY